MGRFAENTTVSSEKSRAEIERILSRYNADSFAYMSNRENAAIAFRVFDRQVRFVLPMPDPHSREFTHTPTRQTLRNNEQRAAAYEQAVRQKWRALALAVKAKLEAVESGIAMFDEEFMAHIVLPDGNTMGQHLLPQIAEAYESGKMPPLLPHLS